MPKSLSAFALIALCTYATCARAAAQTPKTPTGIQLDSAWKQSVYAFAQKNVVHPAWGLAHSERDYQMTLVVATQAAIAVDLDVLLAAAFLHDLGGMAGFEKDGVDHAVRSAELAEPLLKTWGFPMEKFPLVKEMILGHTYYGPKPTTDAAKAFRDADVLDFLGTIGVARILAITEESGGVKGTLTSTTGILNEFALHMKDNCLTDACRTLAAPRQAQLERFLLELKEQSFDDKAL